MIKAVIFDSDGLMFNTEELSNKVWHEYAKKHDEFLDEEFFMGIKGTSEEQCLRHYVRYPFIQHEITNIKNAKTKSIEVAIKNNTIKKVGLEELVRYLMKRRIKIAVATSATSDYLKKLLSTLDDDVNFDIIVTKEDVKIAKPDPDIFLVTAKKLGVEKENCLVLEDSYNGLLGAKRASMMTVFVEDTIKYNDMIKEVSDHYAKNLLEVKGLFENDII